MDSVDLHVDVFVYLGSNIMVIIRILAWHIEPLIWYFDTFNSLYDILMATFQDDEGMKIGALLILH